MKRKATRREVATIAAELDRRLEDTQVLLAAAALQYGEGGQMTIASQRLEDVTRLAPTRTIAVRVLTSGDLRVDFSERARESSSDMTVTVMDEEAACSST